jgi:ATP dependent DNA ligase domain
MNRMTARSDGYILPCIPTRAYKVLPGPDWVHEIKHDGYRLQVRRDGDTVRLFTRRGYDWSGPFCFHLFGPRRSSSPPARTPEAEAIHRPADWTLNQSIRSRGRKVFAVR